MVSALREGQKRIESLPIEGNDFMLISDNIRKISNRGYELMQQNQIHSTDGQLHEWRKHVKILLISTGNTDPFWATIIAPYAEKVARLSDYLGNDHDLAVLDQRISERKLVINDDTFKQQLKGCNKAG